MLVGTRYTDKECLDEYDTIVVGSGIGGLCLASLLSLIGEKVCVLEGHYTAGGYCHDFTRKGYTWDVGVHYVGQVHLKDHPIANIFKLIGNDEIRWHKYSDVTDKIKLGDFSFNFKNDSEKVYIDSLVKKFPKEKNNIIKYVKLCKSIFLSAKLHYVGLAMPQSLDFLTKRLGRLFQKEAKVSTLKRMREIFNDELLINTLCSIYPDYGLSPSESSFAVHAIVSYHYSLGGSFPEGGGSLMISKIVDGIQSRGSHVFTRCLVDEILVSDKGAYGVRTSKGRIIKAKNVVSNCGYHKTYNELLAKKNLDLDFLNELNTFKLSSASFVSYIGLSEDVDPSKLPAENIIIHPKGQGLGALDEASQNFEKDPSKNELAYLFITFPSRKNPLHKGAKQTAIALTTIDFKHFKKWQQSRWKQRPIEYDEYKSILNKKVIDLFLKNFPELNGKISYVESSTPLSNKHYVQKEFGEIYGAESSPKRISSRLFRPRGRIKNLYHVGSDNMFGGVAPSVVSGVQAFLVLRPLKGFLLLLKNGILKN